MSDAVRYESAGPDGLGVLRLNRPNERNSMTAELLDAFAARIEEVKRDAHLRCLIVTGSGPCFSAGADLKSQIQRHGDGPTRMPHEASFAMYTSFLALLDVEVPVIGALNGHAVGGGFGLALLCDIRIGNAQARYGANFTRLGLHPGLAIAYTLPRLIGLPRASELLYTGRLVDGVEAERLGIVSRAVPPDEVMAAATQLARDIASAAPLAVRATKATLRGHLAWEVREAARREAFAQAATVTTEDFKEGMAALFDKREPNFSGR
jgi:enoyl-CoA hydratase/carnithine racemase